MKHKILLICFLVVYFLFVFHTQSVFACGTGGICRWNCLPGETQISGTCAPFFECCDVSGLTCQQAGGWCDAGGCNGSAQQLSLPGCPPLFSCCYIPQVQQNIPFASWESILTPNIPAGSGIGFIINTVLNYLFPLLGIVLLIYLIFGGFTYMTSTGDPKKIQSAKLTLTYALAGFAIFIAAYWVVLFVAELLDIPIIISIFQ